MSALMESEAVESGGTESSRIEPIPAEPRPARLLGIVRRQRWWAGRIAVLPVHIAVWALVVFFLVRAIPGNPVVIVTGGQYTPAIYAHVKHELGLDGSTFHQLGHYFWQLLHFRLGSSILSGTPVVTELKTRLPATVELALQSMTAVIVTSFIASYVAVMHPKNLLSRIIRGYARTAGAIPEFCVGIALIVIFYAELHWAPAPLGRVSPSITPPASITGFPFLDTILRGDWSVAGNMLEHLILPLTVEIVAQSAVMIRLLISGLEEAVDAPATRFRIASGASRRMVVLSVYRRALPATVAMLGMLFGYLLGGAVILESLFGFAGMGQYMVDAVNSKDFVVMQGVLIVIAAVALTVFLLVDLVNMVLDPRRKPGVRSEGS
jgi:ABC-type dipeptide/oligopeptide/nickel transport system permease component